MNFWMRLRERFVNWYPPLLGAGIRSKRIDERTILVTMKLTAFNRNIVGVHFGGSLYAMCDPWFMLILMRLLGGDYIVWDKAAAIQFIKPGRGAVSAKFHISQEQVEEIRRAAESGKKYQPVFSVEVVDEEGQPVARVDKVLYVKRRRQNERLSPPADKVNP
jgi:acyl-coenzyme A thioesterase PaaI-like protein